MVTATPHFLLKNQPQGGNTFNQNKRSTPGNHSTPTPLYSISNSVTLEYNLIKKVREFDGV